MAQEMPADSHIAMVSREITACKTCGTDEITRKADDLPPPIDRKEPQLVTVDLYTEELVAEMAPGATCQYWTYNSKVPGLFSG